VGKFNFKYADFNSFRKMLMYLHSVVITRTKTVKTNRSTSSVTNVNIYYSVISSLQKTKNLTIHTMQKNLTVEHQNYLIYEIPFNCFYFLIQKCIANSSQRKGQKKSQQKVIYISSCLKLMDCTKVISYCYTTQP